MNREVFRTEIFGKMMFSILFSAILLFLAFVSGKILLYLLLIIPILILVNDIKAKLVIENGFLRFERLRTDDEIDLKDVSRFITHSIAISSSTKKVVHVVDKTGTTQFEFPFEYITNKNRRRFEDTVLSINGKITFTVASINRETGG